MTRVLKRVLRYLGLGLLLLAVVIVAGLGFVLGTETGFQQALALGQRFAPGTLSWQSADGRLIGPLTVNGLHYRQDNGLDAAVEELQFDWSPSALVGRELVIDKAMLAGVVVHVPETTTPAENTATDEALVLPEITLPLAVRLENVSITDVVVYSPGVDSPGVDSSSVDSPKKPSPLVVHSVALAATFENSDLQVTTLEVTAPQGAASVSGNVQTRDNYPMDLALDWQTDVGQFMPAEAEGVATDVDTDTVTAATGDYPLAGQGTVTGDLLDLRITHRVSGVALADISANVASVLTAPAWEATIETSLAATDSLPIPALDGLLTSAPTLSVTTHGTLDDFNASASLAAATTDTGPVTLDAVISGSTRQIDIEALTARLTDSGGEFSATGQLGLEMLDATLQGQWQRLGWPLVGEPAYRSAIGHVTLQGSPEAFSLVLDAEVDGEMIPSGSWQFSTDGSTTGLDSFSLQGETLEGTITAHGSASWNGAPSWDVILGTDGINPGVQWADFPGSIDLELVMSGVLREQRPALVLDINRLSGSLRGEALSGGGQVGLLGETLAIDTLQVALGPSRLRASGTIDRELALAIDVASTDLATLMPDLRGTIALEGTVSGERERPVLTMSGSANDVAYADNRIASLSFAVDGGLGIDTVSTVSLVATDIVAGGQTISDITLDGGGTQADHRLSLALSSGQGDIATELTGSYTDAAWQGTMRSLRLDDTPAGNWALREPVAFSARAADAVSSPLCLDNGSKLGSLCVEGRWLAEGETSVSLTLDRMSSRLVADYLPVGIAVQTALDGKATASLGATGELGVNSRLVLQPGTLVVDAAGTPVEIGLERTTIDAGWRDAVASMTLDGAFTDVGRLHLQAAIADPAGAGRLSGQAAVDFTDLTLISAFAPQVQSVTGVLSSDLTFAGTLAAPVIEGELALRDFGAEIPETAMVLEATQLRVTGGRDGILHITGESLSGDGRLGISGSVDPATRAVDLAIEGADFEVANTAMIQAVISPEFNVRIGEAGMRVDGRLAIPRAYINANGGNEGIKTVSASSDVVFVSDEDEAPPEEAASAASQVRVDMQILLGDSIEIEAGDFRGRVEGDLRVEQSPGTAPRGTGTINVVNGDFVVYGQQLNMERGRILFGGGPVDNPTLDMEVAREVPEFDVVAGAKIQGTAQSPRLELYSEPSMPDASILSFILRGQPPDSMSASYTLGKYLTPDLYVSYGIGLFDAINTFNMRYRLTEKLSLEAESGGGSSADLIYTIER